MPRSTNDVYAQAIVSAKTMYRSIRVQHHILNPASVGYVATHYTKKIKKPDSIGQCRLTKHIDAIRAAKRAGVYDYYYHCCTARLNRAISTAGHNTTTFDDAEVPSFHKEGNNDKT